MKWEYLAFNFLCAFSPLIASVFIPVKKEVINRKALTLSLLLPALPFIIYDIIVTGHFWSFHERYILGLHIFSIPLEEALFFFSVPFASLFLWINLRNRLTPQKVKFRYVISYLLLPFAIPFVLNGMYNTASVIGLFIISLFVDEKIGSHLYEEKKWYYFVGIVIILTTIFNYYLTARPIVLYNDIFKSGLMVLTIPIEDYIFGISLINLNASLYTFFEKKFKGAKPH